MQSSGMPPDNYVSESLSVVHYIVLLTILYNQREFTKHYKALWLIQGHYSQKNGPLGFSSLDTQCRLVF